MSAGHPAPVILADEPRSVSIEAAPPLGVLPLSSWPVHEVEIQPSEGVLIYTDGLIEGRVEPGSQERFGVDRLLDLVAERRLAASPEELESVIREIARVGGGLPDDVAALILLPATKGRRRRSADAARAARGD